MKPEYIGIGNFDEDNYVYAYCNCPLPADYAIKWPRIKDGKVHSYTCTCEDCGTEVGVVSKSYGPEVYEEKSEDYIGLQTILNNLKFSVTNKKGAGMTREEAIKELSYIADDMPSMECADWIEAISMAIKELEQEPCTDTISRQAAIKAICRHCAPEKPEKCPTAKICHSYQELKSLPPVTSAEKVGKWLTTCLSNIAYCSECDNLFRDIPASIVKQFKYCPMCGHRMEEVKE